MYSERRTAQMAAFMLIQCGKQMAHLKLMKLLYLADREAVKRYGRSISEDYAVAMPHGPVLSMTLDLMSGNCDTEDGGWDTWISAKADHQISLLADPGIDDLDELSAADLEVLDAVWQTFGHMDRWQIRDWTHENCPEWKDPKGSSNPITEEDLYRAVGYSPEAASELLDDFKNHRGIDAIFSNL